MISNIPSKILNNNLQKKKKLFSNPSSIPQSSPEKHLWWSLLKSILKALEIYNPTFSIPFHKPNITTLNPRVLDSQSTWCLLHQQVKKLFRVLTISKRWATWGFEVLFFKISHPSTTSLFIQDTQGPYFHITAVSKTRIVSYLQQVPNRGCVGQCLLPLYSALQTPFFKS